MYRRAARWPKRPLPSTAVESRRIWTSVICEIEDRSGISRSPGAAASASPTAGARCVQEVPRGSLAPEFEVQTGSPNSAAVLGADQSWLSSACIRDAEKVIWYWVGSHAEY